MSGSFQSQPIAQLNVFLPFPLATADFPTALATGPGRDHRPSREHYAETRAAAAELEGREDISFELPQQLDLVGRIVTALAQHPSIGMSMARAADVATEQAGSIGYMTVDEIDPRIGPPAGVPVYNPYIGLLSVAEPEDGGAAAVSTALQGVDPGLKVERAVRVYAIGSMGAFGPLGTTAPTTASTPGIAMTNGHGAVHAPGASTTGEAAPPFDAEELWPEAALEAGVAAETIPWGVGRVHAPQAWAHGYTGRGVRVAVVDTGIAPHVDLPVPVAGHSFVPGVGTWNDDNGHGTHVSGTIGARRNGRGVIGVAPQCDLIAVKVLAANGSGSDAAVANGIVWAANNGAQVINMSLGSASYSEAIHRALVYARSRRVAICAAAGNDSSPTVCRPVIYPARDPLCIAVAATTPANGKAGFSCCGPELDLAAPGVDVMSTWPGNAYRVLNGTSMATPHVTGSAALLLQRAPGLDPSRLQRHLERSAMALGAPAQFGRGLVQCDRAVTIPILSVISEAVGAKAHAADEGAEGGHEAVGAESVQKDKAQRASHARPR